MNTHSIGATIAAAALAGMLGLPNALLRLSAQSPVRDAPEPAFEVASVTPNKSGDPGASFGGRPGGQLVVRNNTLRNIIRNTYGLQEFQIVGGPEWINSDRFDIVAKAADDAPEARISNDAPQARMLLMVRTLLADRFKLAVHTETREIPIYALVMARSDGRPGPQLRPAAVDCAAMLAAARGGGAPLPRAPAGERPICGMQTAPGRMMAGGYALPDVARNLSPFTGRIVVDKTGLSGTFDLDLAWTPDQIPTGPRPPGAPAFDPNGPSLFTAVQEQLGLKLDSQRGPVEVLVIDRAERPTAD
jgi:uncharacterized protein (TIGR03435 family)